MGEPSSVFEPGERAVLEAFARRGVSYMVVGLSAAVLQGANTATRNIDLWFEDVSDHRIGGDAVGDRLDVVTHMHGLGSYRDEAANTIEMDVDGIRLRVLKLERVIASKRASARPKDLAALPALEEALVAQKTPPGH